MKKQPPYSKEVEQAILACMLLDENSVAKVVSEASVEYFYNPPHQYLARSIFELFKNRKPVDVVTVLSSMSDEDLQRAGGVEYVSSLVDIIPTVAGLPTYLEKLRELWQLRQLIGIAYEAQIKAYEHTEDVSQIAADMGRRVADVCKSRGTVYDIGMLSDRLYERFDRFTSRETVGFKCGIPRIDSVFSGIQPGFYIIGGRPHMGKSSFSMRIAGGMGRNGARGLIFQFDGSVEGYAEKMLCQIGGFSRFDLTFGKATANAFTAAMGKLDSLNIRIVGERMDAFGIRAKVQAERENIDYIVVDQMHTIPSANPKDDEIKRLTINAQVMKGISVDFGVPVIAPAQVNRTVEKGNDKRPYASDLKGSGALEEEADVIMLLYRDEVYNDKTADVGITEVDICKNKLTEICPKPLRLTKAESWDIWGEV